MTRRHREQGGRGGPGKRHLGAMAGAMIGALLAGGAGALAAVQAPQAGPKAQASSSSPDQAAAVAMRAPAGGEAKPAAQVAVMPSGADALAATAAPPDAAAAPEAEAVTADVEREARALAASGREPAVLEHGDFVQVPFGHQVPVVRCAPLRVCLIELEDGELVLGTVTGDAVRWIVDRAEAGPRGATTVIVAKPTACNLTTNLVVTTDRRIYQITLGAPPCKTRTGENPHEPFTRLLRFYYPDDLVRTWNRGAAARRAAAAEEARDLTPLAAGVSPAALNFNYRWKRSGRFPWVPVAVFDDAVHTYIRLPGSGAGQEAPVLFLIDEKGGMALLNYAVRGQTWVTDRVFDRAALVIGSGRGQQRLDITREARP